MSVYIYVHTSFCKSLELLSPPPNSLFFFAVRAAAAAGSVACPRFRGLMSILVGAFSEPFSQSSDECAACPEAHGGNRSSWKASDCLFFKDGRQKRVNERGGEGRW